MTANDPSRQEEGVNDGDAGLTANTNRWNTQPGHRLSQRLRPEEVCVSARI